MNRQRVKLLDRDVAALQRQHRRLRYDQRNNHAEPYRPRNQRRQIYLGKTATAIDKGASGTVHVYVGTIKGSETQHPSLSLVGVYNRFGDVASGKWVHVEWLNGGWELSAAEC